MSATRTVTIDVTADDIRRGLRACCEFCPIALAVGRALGVIDVAVICDLVVIEEDDHDDWPDIDLPPEAVAFVEAFDAGRPVEPFTFTLEVPS